jgi:CHAT domain-containing protein
MNLKFTFFCILFSCLVHSQSLELKEVVLKNYELEKKEDFRTAKENLGFFLTKKKILPQEIAFAKAYIYFYDFLISNAEDKKFLDKAFSIAVKLKKRNAFETELLVNLYVAKIHYEANFSTWEDALNIAQKGLQLSDFKNAKLETQTDYLYDLGFLYDKTGNYFESIQYYKKSLDLYIKQFGPLDKEVALNYNNLAYAYKGAHNSKNTIKYYLKAAEIWEKIHKTKPDTNDYLLTVYQNLENQFLEYGDFEKAKWATDMFNFHFNKKYLNLENKQLPTYINAKMRYVLCNIRIINQLDKIKQAEKLINDLLTDKNFEAKDTNQLMYVLQSYLELMQLCLDKKEYNQLINYGNIANSLNEKNGAIASFRVTINSLLALAYQKLKMPQKALVAIEKAINSVDKNKFNSSKFSVFYIKSSILRDLSNKSEALKITEKNIQNLIYEISKSKKNLDKIQFNDVKNLVSIDFIKLFYRSGELYLQNYDETKDKKQLIIADILYKISNKLFKEYYLKEEYNEELSKCQKGIIEGLLEIELKKKMGFQDKIEMINSIEQNASQHLLKCYLRKLKLNNPNSQLLAELNTELNFYQKEVVKSDANKPFNINKIRLLKSKIATLKKKTSQIDQKISQFSASNFDVKKVLNTLIEDQTILKYYVTEHFVYCVKIQKNDLSIHKVGKTVYFEKLLKQFIQLQKNPATDCSKITKSLASLLPKSKLKRKITIIPDGLVNYIPFESISNVSSEAYLVQKHLISYEYSLPLLLFNKQYKTTFNLLSSAKLVAFSPLYNSQEITQKRSNLKNLMFAEKEANTISQLFNGTKYLSYKATKATFLKEKNNFNIFHLSMHSQLFDDDFNKSCLVFSNDEKLYFNEMYNLNFPASMVVLSACDTGNGELKNGEGIMSMSRALTYAGVKSAVVSLWQVPDKETSEIMISFYQNLKKGQPKDEALANAKITFISNNPMKKHPFYWAGFVVNGDVSPIVSNSNWMIYIGLGLVILALIFFFRKKLFQFRQ